MTKRADDPTLAPSMRIAPTGLKPDEHHVVYPGEKRDTPAKNVEAVPLSQRVKAT